VGGGKPLRPHESLRTPNAFRIPHIFHFGETKTKMNKNAFTPFTTLIIAICALSLAAESLLLSSRWFFRTFGLNPLVFDGYFWQPLTTMFVHGSFLHLLMNMLVLLIFGARIERYIGSANFAALYLVCGVLTSLCCMAWIHFYPANIFGASGAICSLLGFVAHRDRQNFTAIALWVLAMSFLPFLYGANVAWQSHIFGFLVGLFAAKMRIFG